MSTILGILIGLAAGLMVGAGKTGSVIAYIKAKVAALRSK